jgi:hypothetical protein
MSTATCIYCQEHLALTEFNTEHVLPRSFARFRGNLTLAPNRNAAVCRVCNQAFGETLDRFLARESYEAFLRIKQGVIDAADLRSFFGGRVSFSLPPESRWGPLQVVLASRASGEPILDLVPQVRVAKVDGGYVCFSEQDLAGVQLRSLAGLDLDKIAIFSSSDDGAEQRLKEELQRQGISLSTWSPIPGLPSSSSPSEEVELVIAARVDASIARAIAKIGMNYLAYVAGASFALRSDFDGVRSFVCDGVGDWRGFVEYSDTPILYNDSEELRHTDGHLIVLEWEPGSRDRLRCRVSLFNDFTYAVRLCEGFRGVWRDLASGHFYGLRSHTVRPLGHSRLVQPVRTIRLP